MSYSRDVPLVEVTIPATFEFFGAGSVLHTTVTPVLTGTSAIKRGRWWGNVITGTRPIYSGYQRRFTLPVVEATGWTTKDGEPHGAWSYAVEVYVTAPGRAPVRWVGSLAPATTAPLTLSPATGAITSEVATGIPGRVDPTAGGLGTLTFTPDPNTDGSYLIGE